MTYTSAGGTVGGYAKMFGKVVAGNIFSTGKSCPQGVYTTIATISHPPTFDSMYAPVYSANDGSFVGMARINVNGNVEVFAHVATTTPALSFAYIRQ